MKEIVLVFVGGGLGSVVRYSLGRWVTQLHDHQFPWGTLAVNVVACLILGFVVGLADHKQLISAPARLFWTVGFCGGFSTFSTFSQETLQLAQTGLTTSAILYIGLSLCLCIAAVWVGIMVWESF